MALLGGAPEARAEGTIPLAPCAGTPLIAGAGVAWGTSNTHWTREGGPPHNAMVSVAPTARARAAVDRASLADRVWRDLHRCVAMPRALSTAQRRSLRMQLLCHAHWSAVPLLRLGGRAWELEAWRPAVSRAAVLSPQQIVDPDRRCNWGPDSGPPMTGL